MVLAKRHGINPRTVARWKKRTTVKDLPIGPKDPRSTVLSIEEEAIIVAFRKHSLLPLDDCLYALQETIPHLTRSSLHRCLQRHRISRLPNVKDDKKTQEDGHIPLATSISTLPKCAQLKASSTLPLRSSAHRSSPSFRSPKRQAGLRHLNSSKP